MKMFADAVSHQIPDHAVSEGFRVRLDRLGNIVEMIPGFGVFYTFKETFSRHFDEFCRLRTDLAYRVGPGGVRVIAFVDHAGVQADDVALLDDVMAVGNAVHHLIVDGYADRGGIAVVILKGRDAAVAADNLFPQPVDIQRGHAGPQRLAQFLMGNGKDFSGLPHQLNFPRGFDGY